VMTEDQRVAKIIKDNVADAVQTLADITKDKDAKKSDRIAAAEALLNRRYGRPNQPVNKNDGVDLNTLSIAEVAAELPQTEQTATNRAEGEASPPVTSTT